MSTRAPCSAARAVGVDDGDREGERQTVVPEIADELADGRLLRVLAEWTLPMLSVDALMPPRESQPANVRAALDALRKSLTVSDRRAAAGRRRHAVRQR
jgi:hypothetical protein